MTQPVSGVMGFEPRQCGPRMNTMGCLNAQRAFGLPCRLAARRLSTGRGASPHLTPAPPLRSSRPGGGSLGSVEAQSACEPLVRGPASPPGSKVPSWEGLRGAP